jgi:hypothetical protein
MDEASFLLLESILQFRGGEGAFEFEFPDFSFGRGLIQLPNFS